MRFLQYLFFILFLTGKLFSIESKQTQNILVIHSYHQQFEWTKKINDGIESVLATDENIKNIYVEYLDFKRHQSKTLYQHYSNVFKEKYHNDSLSLVIISDNFAFEFILKHRKNFIQNTPIVFCGLNHYSSYKGKIGKNITGI